MYREGRVVLEHVTKVVLEHVSKVHVRSVERKISLKKIFKLSRYIQSSPRALRGSARTCETAHARASAAAAPPSSRAPTSCPSASRLVAVGRPLCHFCESLSLSLSLSLSRSCAAFSSPRTHSMIRENILWPYSCAALVSSPSIKINMSWF